MNAIIRAVKKHRYLFIAIGTLAIISVAIGILLLQEKDHSLQQIRDLGVLRVGLDPSFPPFETLDENGEIVGFDADLAHKLAQRWGVQVKFESIGFDGLYDALWAGKVDMVISALPLEPRLTRDVAFSQPYFEAGLHLVTRVDSVIENERALEKRTLAVEWGSEADAESRAMRKRVENLNVLTVESSNDALQAVLAEKADAALVDGVSARQFLAQHAEKMRLIEPAIVGSPYVIALPIKSSSLLSEVDQALVDLQKDGSIAAIAAKWFAP